MTALTPEQIGFLNDQKNKYVDFRLFVVEKYTPAVFENIKEMRETIRNLSITSGAIGALTIGILDKEVVKNKLTVLPALLIFLFVVWLGFFYLKYILEKENRQLSERTDSLHKSITDIRNQIDKALSENSHEEALKFLDISKKLEEVVQEEKKIDNWFVRYIGDLMLVPFTIGCILLVVSFVDINLFEMMNVNYFYQIAFWLFATFVTLFYTLFAPEALFHNTYKKESPKLFDRWKDKRLVWNIHQSFIHFVGSSLGFISLYILLFSLGINDASKYSIVHLLLFLIAASGVMGFIPRILFGSTIGKP